MYNPLGLGQFSGTIPSYQSYGGDLNMQGLKDQLGKAGLAGRYMNINPEEVKQYKDVFGEDTGSLAYLLDRNRQYQQDPQRLKEQLEVLGPWYKDIAATNQKYGLQSNLVGAGIQALRDIPATMNAFRAIPLQGLYEQANTVPNVFAQYGSGRPGFAGIRSRLGRGG